MQVSLFETIPYANGSYLTLPMLECQLGMPWPVLLLCYLQLLYLDLVPQACLSFSCLGPCVTHNRVGFNPLLATNLDLQLPVLLVTDLDLQLPVLLASDLDLQLPEVSSLCVTCYSFSVTLQQIYIFISLDYLLQLVLCVSYLLQIQIFCVACVLATGLDLQLVVLP